MRSFVRKGIREKKPWADLGRHHEHQPVGHGYESVLVRNVGFALAIVRADQLIAQSELAAEIGGPGFFGQEGIGAGFDPAVIGIR